MSSFAIVVVGVGNIASAWLDQFASKLPAQAQLHSLHSSQKSLLLAPAQLNQWRSLWQQAGERCDLAQLITSLRQQQLQVIVLDLTASKIVSRDYPQWFAAGADIVSANKYAGSSNPDFYQQLQQQLQQSGQRWLYNTTVGAGLPVQRTIRERLACHDQLRRLEGNFSGSLSWIFQHYRPGDRLSDWLQQAVQRGLTEPDPRLDLSGMDVARKLLILAREAGWQLALADISITNLVPPALRDCSLEQFWQQRDSFDQHFEQWRLLKHPQAQQFCYLGAVQQHSHGVVAAAELTPITSQSPYAHLPAGNANFIIYSQHYAENPLIIQGPGAGREVTAAGVHSDILELIN